MELNVRGWTPGVEPCAETKSSRHCHLGRDARVFYTRWRVSILRIPFPVLCLVPLAPVLVAKRLPMSIPRGPLFGLSGRCIREQRDDSPTNLSSLSSFAFEKIDEPKNGENNTVKARLYALVDCSPLGRTRPRKRWIKRGVEKAKEGEERKGIDRRYPAALEERDTSFRPVLTSSPPSASQ